MFNQSIESLKTCINLLQITFGIHFNQSIEPLVNCSHLTRLYISKAYNKSLDILRGVNIIII
jgi:hypothetical protein